MNGAVAVVIGLVLAAGWFLSTNVRVALKALIVLLVVAAVAVMVGVEVGYGSLL
jgi:hypothetical protein